MWTTLRHRGAPPSASASGSSRLHRVHRVTQLKFSAFDGRAHLAALRAKITLDLMGGRNVGPVPLPRRRKQFHFLKSPFKWKKKQELWEIRTSSRLLTFEASVEKTREVMKFIKKKIYGGVGVRIRRLEFEPLDKYYKDPYLHTAEVDLGPRLARLRESRGRQIQWHTLAAAPAGLPAEVITMREGAVERREAFSARGDALDYGQAGVLDEDVLYDDGRYRFRLPASARLVDRQIEAATDRLIADARLRQHQGEGEASGKDLRQEEP